MKDKLRTSLLKFEEAWKEITTIWTEHPEECNHILAGNYPFMASFDKLKVSDWVRAADIRMGNIFKYVPISPDNEPYPVEFSNESGAKRYIEKIMSIAYWRSKNGLIEMKGGRLLGLQEAIDACRIISYNTNSDETD